MFSPSSDDVLKVYIFLPTLSLYSIATSFIYIDVTMVLGIGSLQSCMATSNNALVSMPVHLGSSGAFFSEKTFQNVARRSVNATTHGLQGIMPCPTSRETRAARRKAVMVKAAGEAPWASKPSARYVGWFMKEAWVHEIF